MSRNAHCKVFNNSFSIQKARNATRMCKYCDKQIWWKKIEGKWKPLNNDDTPHNCKI